LHPSINREPLGGAWLRNVFAADPLDPLCRRMKTELPGQWMILGDIDQLLFVNDKYGHVVGDLAIREVVQALQEVVGDRVIRFGGDEILIPYDGERAPEITELLRRRVAETRYPSAGRLDEVLRVTMSFGVVPMGPFETTIRQAEEAVHRAKEAGRDCVVVAGA
jgi:diguanylate cyclase (GGDEF)-like protein